MYGHVKFPKIGGFHNVVRTMDHLAEFHGYYISPQNYRAKIKLHGANMAIRIGQDGSLSCQSRNQDLESGGYQFPLFVGEQAEYLSGLANPVHELVIFGEWAGPGIQRKVSVSKIEHKAFFVFAVMEQSDESQRFIFEPSDIETLLTQHSPLPNHIFIIPWFAEKLTLDFEDKSQLREHSDLFNADVAKIDGCDPYVKALFGVEGPGEGLVYFPLNVIDPEDFGRLAFKVKGDRHSKGGGEKKAQVKTPISESVLAFVDEMVTPARVLQGATELFGEGPYEKKGLGPLIKWVLADVQSESQDERDASGINWGDASKSVPQKVREHYFAEVERI